MVYLDPVKGRVWAEPPSDDAFHPIPDTDLQVSTTAGLLDSWEGGICQGIDIYATYAEIIGICCE